LGGSLSEIDGARNVDNNTASRVPCPEEKQCHVASSLEVSAAPWKLIDVVGRLPRLASAYKKTVTPKKVAM
jgi:hypothetical protein